MRMRFRIMFEGCTVCTEHTWDECISYFERCGVVMSTAEYGPGFATFCYIQPLQYVGMEDSAEY